MLHVYSYVDVSLASDIYHVAVKVTDLYQPVQCSLGRVFYFVPFKYNGNCICNQLCILTTDCISV